MAILQDKQFCHQKADPKGILKLHEQKTWKKMSQYNIEMYITGFINVFC